MRPIVLSAALVLTLALSGCGDDAEAQVAAQPAAPSTTSANPERDRLIRNTEAASAVGYDGAALRKQVQKTVDQNDAHNKAIEDAVNAAEASATR